MPVAIPESVATAIVIVVCVLLLWLLFTILRLPLKLIFQTDIEHDKRPGAAVHLQLYRRLLRLLPRHQHSERPGGRILGIPGVILLVLIQNFI